MVKGTRLFIAVALLYGLFFGFRGWWIQRQLSVVLETAKTSYHHDEFIEIRLRSRDPRLIGLWKSSPPEVEVRRQGVLVTTIAGLSRVRMKFDDDEGALIARWPCPWNAEVGVYEPRLVRDLPGEPGRRFVQRSFRIETRKPVEIPQGFSVLTLESAMPFKTMKVKAPDGSVKGWQGLLDWVEYMGADAFWVMGGQTPGNKPGELWASDNFTVLPEMARECRRRGIKFGIYAMCYLTMSSEKLPRYEYARDVVDGRSVATRAISIREPHRSADVLSLLKKFAEIPGVDYLGLDYIRNALGGYELVDDFYAEMPGLQKPPGWDRLTLEERMVTMARKKAMRRDMAFIDAWQWWRAHRVAKIVRRIKDSLGAEQPLWAFTLTWDKGWHHGQDPVMMNDAGIDVDALMLYEADEEQFQALLGDWNRYVKRSDVQLLVGNIVDWSLHQRSTEGPKAMSRRLKSAVNRIYSDGPARGLFVHDIGRALWGRLGEWSTRAWMDEARSAVEHLKSVSREPSR